MKLNISCPQNCDTNLEKPPRKHDKRKRKPLKYVCVVLTHRAHKITNRQRFISLDLPNYYRSRMRNTKNSSYALLAPRAYFTASNSGATHDREMLGKSLQSRKCSSFSIALLHTPSIEELRFTYRGLATTTFARRNASLVQHKTA